MKRDPLLIDEFLAAKFKQPLISNSLHERLKDLAHLSKRFVLDSTASQAVAELVLQHPEVVANGIDFALPPFEKTWIELDANQMFKLSDGSRIDETIRKRVGFMIDWPSVYVLYTLETKKYPKYTGAVVVTPIKYKMFQPFTDTDIRKMELGKDTVLSLKEFYTFFWGREPARKIIWKSPDDMTTQEFVECQRVLSVLTENHSFEDCSSISIPSHSVTLGHSLHDFALASDGQLAFIVATLLMLNRTSKIQIIDDVPAGSKLIQRAPRTLLKHSVIRLKLNPIPQLLTLGSHTGIWRREHDVRAHFCHNKIAKNAEARGELHRWEEYGVNQWKCLDCKGLKWHRKEHRRGHREKGSVVTVYDVVE